MKDEVAVQTLPYKVKDIALADFGRKEIEIAEKEMPRHECQLTGGDLWLRNGLRCRIDA